jgi:CRISPR-associated protein Cmr1
MYSVNLDLEIVTPLFMAGADGRTPELRPPSFKGMMRFWWRAMKGEDDITKLAEEEASIFGGTGKEEGRSKVSLKLFGRNLKTNRFTPLPHKQTIFTFLGFEPKQDFKCVATFGSISDKETKIALAALRLALLLGGFGKRSRRGFGSISYKAFNNLAEVVEEIRDIDAAINKNRTFNGNGQKNEYSIILERDINVSTPAYPRIRKIHLGRNYTSSHDELLKKIGDASHTNRDNALGAINPRMASPIVITIAKVGKSFYPIATELTSHFPEGYTHDIKAQFKFIKEVLQ